MSETNGVDMAAFKEMAESADLQAQAMQGAIAMAMQSPAKVTTVGQCGLAIGAGNPAQGIAGVLQVALMSGERIDVPLPVAALPQLRMALAALDGEAA